MRAFCLFLGFLFSLISLPAMAENNIRIERIFEGKIGNSDIILYIEDNYNNGVKTTNAEYFYKKHHKLITLFDIGVKDNYSLQEINYDCMPDAEDNCSPNATLIFFDKNLSKGVFKLLKPDAKPIDISLNQIWSGKSALRISDNNYNENGKTEFYKYLTNNGVTYSKPIIKGVFGYQTAIDNLTKVSYPFINKFPNLNAKTKANAWLNFKRNQMVGWAIECYSMPVTTSPGHGTFGDYDSYSSEITYISNKLMVIRESGSTYCDGAHPNNTYGFSMWDFTKNREFRVSDYLNLYLPIKKGEYEAKKTTIYSQFSKKLTPNSKYSLAANKDKEMVEQCFADDFSLELTPSFNEKGMVLSLSDVPHVMGACMDDYYLIPYKDLVPLMTNEGKKFFEDKIR